MGPETNSPACRVTPRDAPPAACAIAAERSIVISMNGPCRDRAGRRLSKRATPNGIASRPRRHRPPRLRAPRPFRPRGAEVLVLPLSADGAGLSVGISPIRRVARLAERDPIATQQLLDREMRAQPAKTTVADLLAADR